MSQEAEGTQPIGNADQDDTVLGEARTIEIRGRGVATNKTAAWIHTMTGRASAGEMAAVQTFR
jgi:hypothetical protein